LSKKLELQKMAPLPHEICVPCPPFSNVGLDLAGPYMALSMIKKKSTRAGSAKMKVWALLIMCLNTRALKIYLLPGYGTADFLLGWTEFIAECGVPRRVHSDRGTQLVSAAGDLEQFNCDWDKISDQDARTVWSFCPAGSQWRNGAIESFVKRFKRSLELYQQSGLNYAELQSTFKKLASLLNSRPISARFGPRHTESDPDYLEIITPNMLLTARTSVNLPLREYVDEDSPGRRLAYKQQLELDWWAQWKVQCFDSLLPSKSWHTERRGVKIGNVVLISYSDQSKTGTFKLGRVINIEVDEDNLVRTCTVSYRLIRSDMPPEDMRLYFIGIKYKEIRVPVQRLCVILPLEEQEEDFLGYSALPEAAKKSWTSMGKDQNSHRMSKKIEGMSQCELKAVDEDASVGSIDDVILNDSSQMLARMRLIKRYRCSLVKAVNTRRYQKSIAMLHDAFSQFSDLADKLD